VSNLENRFTKTIPWQPRRPLGCDQQGRFPEAAHAASEYEDDADDVRHSTQATAAMLIYSVLAVASLALLVMVSR
jgi:hypothetical protein